LPFSLPHAGPTIHPSIPRVPANPCLTVPGPCLPAPRRTDNMPTP
jgi:hypothetical protein